MNAHRLPLTLCWQSKSGNSQKPRKSAEQMGKIQKPNKSAGPNPNTIINICKIISSFLFASQNPCAVQIQIALCKNSHWHGHVSPPKSMCPFSPLSYSLEVEIRESHDKQSIHDTMLTSCGVDNQRPRQSKQRCCFRQILELECCSCKAWAGGGGLGQHTADGVRWSFQIPFDLGIVSFAVATLGAGAGLVSVMQPEARVWRTVHYFVYVGGCGFVSANYVLGSALRCPVVTRIPCHAPTHAHAHSLAHVHPHAITHVHALARPRLSGDGDPYCGGGGSGGKKKVCEPKSTSDFGPFVKFRFCPEEHFLMWGRSARGAQAAIPPAPPPPPPLVMVSCRVAHAHACAHSRYEGRNAVYCGKRSIWGPTVRVADQQ